MENSFERVGSYMCRVGLAKARGMKSTCKKRVCFVSADKAFLLDVLFKMSNDNDCHEVKYSIEERGGNYFGVASFTNDSSVGDMWARYEAHPKVWVTIQDDEFCETFRSKIRSYSEG